MELNVPAQLAIIIQAFSFVLHAITLAPPVFQEIQNLIVLLVQLLQFLIDMIILEQVNVPALQATMMMEVI